jgi:hypothetical protein
MRMGKCSLQRASIRWQNTVSKVQDRNKGYSRHIYVSQSFHSDGIQQVFSGQQPGKTLLDTDSWSFYAMLHLITVLKMVCVCESLNPAMFVFYQVL